MMKKIIIVLCAVLFWFGDVYASDRFEYLTGSSYVDTQTIKHYPAVVRDYLNTPKLIRQDEGYIDVWVKRVYDENGKDVIIQIRKKNNLSVEGFEKAGYNLSHLHVRTSKGQIKLLQSIEYDSDGIVLENYSAPNAYQTWESVIPESKGDELQQSLVYYVEHQYEKMENEQRKQRELKYLKRQNDLPNQFLWIVSDNKRTVALDTYSVKKVDSGESIIEARVKVTHNQEGVEEILAERQRLYNFSGGNGERVDAGFENLEAEYIHFLFNLKDKQYKQLGWIYQAKNGEVLDVVYMPKIFDKWKSLHPDSIFGKVMSAAGAYINTPSIK